MGNIGHGGNRPCERVGAEDDDQLVDEEACFIELATLGMGRSANRQRGRQASRIVCLASQRDGPNVVGDGSHRVAARLSYPPTGEAGQDLLRTG